MKKRSEGVVNKLLTNSFPGFIIDIDEERISGRLQG